MNAQKNELPKIKKSTKKRRSALVICRDETQFWTTQTQFWQWVREMKIRKIKDNPLTGKFKLPYEQLLIVLGNNVLNVAHQNHIGEVLTSRRFMKKR